MEDVSHTNVCTRCGLALPQSAFDRGTYDGARNMCRECETLAFAALMSRYEMRIEELHHLTGRSRHDLDREMRAIYRRALARNRQGTEPEVRAQW